MRVKKVDTDDSTTWVEEMKYVVDDDMTCEKHAQSIIDFFNSSLRPYEHPRVLVSVVETENKATLSHNWVKHSLVTEKGGYDVYKCTQCEATGKRFGLSSGITPDWKFTEKCK